MMGGGTYFRRSDTKLITVTKKKRNCRPMPRSSPSLGIRERTCVDYLKEEISFRGTFSMNLKEVKDTRVEDKQELIRGQSADGVER